MMKQINTEKLEKVYAQKISNKMRAIDNKYQRMITNREMKKEIEKQKRTKRLMEQLRKDQIALKTWVRTLTPHEKAKQESTAYADACYLAQLDAKLRDTDNEWNWKCITCFDYFTWDQLEWWHCIPKSQSKAIALDYRNINSQCSKCNAVWWWWWKYDIYEVEVDKKWWAWTILDLLRIKQYKKKTHFQSFIQGIILEIEMKLEYKTFDVKYYRSVLVKMKKKYCSDI